MRQQLPERPHLEHLKKQAKALVELHRAGDAAALSRIRESLPALAGATDEAVASAPFALHDAQSVIAREYGFPSFVELATHVEERQRSASVEALLRRAVAGRVPDAVIDAVAKAARAGVGKPPDLGTVGRLPLIAVRNALVSSGATVPLSLSRPSSIAAARAAEGAPARLVAVFPQRDPEVVDPSLADLHDTGCVATVSGIVPQGEAVWVVLRGVAWATLDGLESEETHLVASVSPIARDPDDEGEIAPLAEELRREAKRLARATAPESERFIDEIVDAGALADAVMSNLPGTVAEKVAYAAERRVATRLRRVLDALRAVGAATSA